MARQCIPRNNGADFVGDYDEFVSKGETNGDVKGMGVKVAGGRFCHSFELYEREQDNSMPWHAPLVLIIELHDQFNGIYRDGEEFADIPSMSRFVREYDAISRVPADSRTPEAVSQLSKRYQERSKRFLSLVEEKAIKPLAKPLA